MLVKVDQDLAVTLESPDDFKRFSVSIAGLSEDQMRIRNTITHVGDLVDAETMWVSEDWLRNAPGRIDGSKWQDDVSAMIAAAKKYGWINEATGAIKAHVVWADQGK